MSWSLQREAGADIVGGSEGSPGGVIAGPGYESLAMLGGFWERLNRGEGLLAGVADSAMDTFAGSSSAVHGNTEFERRHGSSDIELRVSRRRPGHSGLECLGDKASCRTPRKNDQNARAARHVCHDPLPSGADVRCQAHDTLGHGVAFWGVCHSYEACLAGHEHCRLETVQG